MLNWNASFDPTPDRVMSSGTASFAETVKVADLPLYETVIVFGPAAVSEVGLQVNPDEIVLDDPSL